MGNNNRDIRKIEPGRPWPPPPTRGAPWPPESTLDLTEGTCLICDRPRYLDPTRGGCSCVGPSRHDLVRVDALLAQVGTETERRWRIAATVLGAVAMGLGLTIAFWLFFTLALI